MFAVIYQSYIKPDLETEFQKLWNLAANYFIKHRGVLSSCLHKTEAGVWVTYSRWPDRSTHDASWPSDDSPSDVLPDDIKMAIIRMKECIDQSRKISDIYMEVVDDLLLSNKVMQRAGTYEK